MNYSSVTATIRTERRQLYNIVFRKLRNVYPSCRKQYRSLYDSNSLSIRWYYFRLIGNVRLSLSRKPSNTSAILQFMWSLQNIQYFINLFHYAILITDRYNITKMSKTHCVYKAVTKMSALENLTLYKVT